MENKLDCEKESYKSKFITNFQENSIIYKFYLWLSEIFCFQEAKKQNDK